MEQVTERGQWVLLSYRMPREPSQPRIAVWRKLERLGVARLGDGLIALPADDRTREQLDRVAEEVVDNGGTASIWIATAGSAGQEQALIEAMRSARAAEYQAVVDEARGVSAGDQADRVRAVRRLRAELRRVNGRDYFSPAQRESAQLAVRELAGQTTATVPEPA